MLYLKSCPRCHGDIKLEADVYGQYLECLQCGFLISSKTDQARKKPSTLGTKAA
jgi:hypothetical protein